MVKLGISINDDLNESKVVENPIDSDWRNFRLCLNGEKDGFKWYVGEYELPLSSSGIGHLHNFTSLTNTIVRLAYVDVSKTKLDGITSIQTIDDLGIDLYRGCTFAGAGESSGLLRRIEGLNRDNWFIGEDYAHDLFGEIEKSFTPKKIAKHIENETIPSILKALVLLDIKEPHFNGQLVDRLA